MQTSPNIISEIATAAADADFGTPSARKSGRNPRWPYVPVIIIDGGDRPIEQQLLGLAFETRDEALDAARRHIDLARRQLARQLAEPRMRALREQHGLPRELDQ